MLETPAKPIELRVLTASAMSTFKRCRKLYKLSYVDLLRPIAEKKYFAFGKAGHEAVNIYETQSLEAAMAYCLAAGGLDDFERQTLAALIRGYADRYGQNSLTVHSREESFNQRIRNPATNSPSLTFTAGGKTDGRISLDHGPALLERKFLNESLDTKFWLRLLIDAQISHYSLHTGIDTVVYDVIRKPAKEPLKATPVEDRKYKKDGTLYANQREFDETPSEWGARLYEDICERPDFYYFRGEIPRLASDLAQYEQEQWDIARDIREAEINARWYRNANRINCNECAYFNVCIGLTPYDGTFAPEGFQFVDDPNQELME